MFLRRSYLQRTERGAMLVEFAIGGVVLLFLVLGIIDYSLLYSRRNRLQLAVTRAATEVAKSPLECVALNAFAQARLIDNLNSLKVVEYARELEFASSALVAGAPVTAIDFVLKVELPCWTCSVLFKGDSTMDLRVAETPVLESERVCPKVSTSI